MLPWARPSPNRPTTNAKPICNARISPSQKNGIGGVRTVSRSVKPICRADGSMTDRQADRQTDHATRSVGLSTGRMCVRSTVMRPKKYYKNNTSTLLKRTGISFVKLKYKNTGIAIVIAIVIGQCSVQTYNVSVSQRMSKFISPPTTKHRNIHYLEVFEVRQLSHAKYVIIWESNLSKVSVWTGHRARMDD